MLNDSGMAAFGSSGIFITQKVLGSLSEIKQNAYTQLDSGKQVIAFYNRVTTVTSIQNEENKINRQIH